MGFVEFRAMAELKTSIRVRAEGLGITFKSIVTFLVILNITYLLF